MMALRFFCFSFLASTLARSNSSEYSSNSSVALAPALARDNNSDSDESRALLQEEVDVDGTPEPTEANGPSRKWHIEQAESFVENPFRDYTTYTTTSVELARAPGELLSEKPLELARCNNHDEVGEMLKKKRVGSVTIDHRRYCFPEGDGHTQKMGASPFNMMVVSHTQMTLGSVLKMKDSEKEVRALLARQLFFKDDECKNKWSDPIFYAFHWIKPWLPWNTNSKPCCREDEADIQINLEKLPGFFAQGTGCRKSFETLVPQLRPSCFAVKEHLQDLEKVLKKEPQSVFEFLEKIKECRDEEKEGSGGVVATVDYLKKKKLSVWLKDALEAPKKEKEEVARPKPVVLSTLFIILKSAVSF